MSRCGECKLGCNEEGALYCEENLGYEQCIDRLQDALYAADRPQGEWKFVGSSIEMMWECPFCGEHTFGFEKHLPNYCSNCGADMREREGE